MFISKFLQSVAEEFTETAPHRYTMEIVTYFRITPFEQSESVSTRQVMGKKYNWPVCWVVCSVYARNDNFIDDPIRTRSHIACQV